MPIRQSVACNSEDSGTKPNESLRMRWDKANLPAYYGTTHTNLTSVVDMDCLDNCSMHCDSGREGIIDNYYMCVVHALQTADSYCVPRKKSYQSFVLFF